MAELWKELHTHAYNYKGTDDSIFLQEFAKKIPRFGQDVLVVNFGLFGSSQIRQSTETI